MKYAGVIYKYTSPSGKVYIGQTTREHDRRELFLNPNTKYSGGGKLENARKKYTPESFRYEVLERVEYESMDILKEVLDELEEFYIGKYNSYRTGYNSTLGGRHDKPMNGKNPNRVLQYTKDGNFLKEWNSINEIVLRYGCDKSAIAACCTGKRNTILGFIWRYYSNNYPDKIHVVSLKHQGKRRIGQYLTDGELVSTFDSVKEAAIAVGLKSHSSISDCCNNKIKSSKGYKWKYIE